MAGASGQFGEGCGGGDSRGTNRAGAGQPRPMPPLRISRRVPLRRRSEGSGGRLMEFTAAQQKAIGLDALDRDTCVVAGPGSGKTTVLIERFPGLGAAGISPRR